MTSYSERTEQMEQSIKDLRELVDYAASRHGAGDAYRYIENRVMVSKSFLDLQRDTRAFGRGLKALGMEGKHVAVVGPTSYQWIAAYLGTTNSGGVIVPLDAQLSPPELCELIARSDASVFVYDNVFAPLIPAVRANCPGVRVLINMQAEEDGETGLSFWKLLRENEGECAPALDREALCAILFTSGTTGKSKGVMLSHKNLTDNALCMDVPYNGENDVVMTVLPIHHAYCFTCDILQGLHIGVPVCINDSLMHLTKNLAAFKPTIMLLVPMIVESVYRQIQAAAKAKKIPPQAVAQAVSGGRLRIIFSGGAYLDPALAKAYQDLGIRLLQGYGMTECAPRIAANSENQNKDGSVGHLVKGCQVRIVDHEIWAKSDSVMLGYYQDPENTAETLEDGWLRTGDLGYLDEDGFLFLTGRKKNLIILSNGENVSPEELENRLSSSPMVREVLVYEENACITAEIFPDYDYARENGVTDFPTCLNGLLDTVNLDLPPYKRIHGLKIRETEFEKTPSKKIKRKY